MPSILLVEDDPVLGKSVSVSLETEGYKVHWAQNLRAAGELEESETLDIVILDLNLPDGNGLSFLKRLRDAGSRLPVIILTARSDEETVVKGLQTGANDYVKKPFGKLELIARIKTALREPQMREDQLRIGDLSVFFDRRKIFKGKKEIELNRREFDLLAYFFQRVGAVITRESLIDALGKDSEIFDRTIDSHVSHIRARLRKAGIKNLQIKSVYGVGYRLEKK